MGCHIWRESIIDNKLQSVITLKLFSIHVNHTNTQKGYRIAWAGNILSGSHLHRYILHAILKLRYISFAFQTTNNLKENNHHTLHKLEHISLKKAQII